MSGEEIDDARRDFLALREHCNGALLATLDDNQLPCASYAPLVWVDDHYYLFLSDLAGHTRNLKHCPSLSLMLIEAEDQAANAFMRQRITLQGSAESVSRDDSSFARVLAEFHHRFGKVMAMIEPLADFHLFRLQLQSGRFVRGFGQAYDLSGEHLQHLQHIGANQ
jgi:putative heme iron utilization protein